MKYDTIHATLEINGMFTSNFKGPISVLLYFPPGEYLCPLNKSDNHRSA